MSHNENNRPQWGDEVAKREERGLRRARREERDLRILKAHLDGVGNPELAQRFGLGIDHIRIILKKMLTST